MDNFNITRGYRNFGNKCCFCDKPVSEKLEDLFYIHTTGKPTLEGCSFTCEQVLCKVIKAIIQDLQKRGKSTDTKSVSEEFKKFNISSFLEREKLLSRQGLITLSINKSILESHIAGYISYLEEQGVIVKSGNTITDIQERENVKSPEEIRKETRKRQIENLQKDVQQLQNIKRMISEDGKVVIKENNDKVSGMRNNIFGTRKH